MQTHIHLAFADGRYKFALGLEQINELQNKCGVGIGALYARVLQGRVSGDIATGHPGFAAYYQADLIETARQGLIGGGEGLVDGQVVKVGTLRADQLIENYFLPLPLVEQWNLAAAILFAKVEGYVPLDEPAPDKKKASPKPNGKNRAGLTTQEPSPTAA